MITISCYTFHPIIQRFVRLYKSVQVVSELVTCILGALCCQCGECGVAMPVPISGATSACSQGSVVESKKDPEKAGGEALQHTVVEFTPIKNDSDQASPQCVQFKTYQIHHEPDAMVKLPNNPEQVLVHKKASDEASRKNDSGTVSSREIQTRGVFNGVFQ